MTDVEKKAVVTECTGETNATTLTTYLALAKDMVLRRAFPFGDGTETMPSKYDYVQTQIASYLINKRGAEGELTHRENGIDRAYSDADIPADLLRQIIPQAVVL